MTIWHDATGRQWTLKLTVLTLKKIKAALGIDLLNSVLAANAITQEPLIIAEILWLIVEDDAKNLGLSANQFFTAIDGPAIAAARDAFFEEWQNFFQKYPEQHRMIDQIRALPEEAAKLALAEVANKIRTPGPSSTSSPELSG